MPPAGLAAVIPGHPKFCRQCQELVLHRAPVQAWRSTLFGQWEAIAPRIGASVGTMDKALVEFGDHMDKLPPCAEDSKVQETFSSYENPTPCKRGCGRIS